MPTFYVPTENVRAMYPGMHKDDKEILLIVPRDRGFLWAWLSMPMTGHYSESVIAEDSRTRTCRPDNPCDEELVLLFGRPVKEDHEHGKSYWTDLTIEIGPVDMDIYIELLGNGWLFSHIISSDNAEVPSSEG